MFKPLNEIQFLADIVLVKNSRKEQNERIQSMLMSATYDAFCVNHEVSGYAAPLFNHLSAAFEPMKGEDLDAMLRWMRTYAPVFYSKKDDSFNVKKEEVEKLALYAIAEESERINVFWTWAVQNGLASTANHWYEMVKSKKERIKQAYNEATMEKDVATLCARLTKHQFGAYAKAINEAFALAKLEAQAEEAQAA